MAAFGDVIAAGSEHLQVATRGMQAYRAHTLCQPHKARQAIRDAYEGRIAPITGFFMGFPTVLTARVVAQLGADFVWVDWEHASCGVETMTDVRKHGPCPWWSLLMLSSRWCTPSSTSARGGPCPLSGRWRRGGLRERG